MKNYILILLLLCCAKTFACSCGMSNVHEKYNRYETIIKARVVKVYPNLSREHNYFKIDIETLKVFKGKELSILTVYGSSDNMPRSSCDMFTPVESIYLMYISKDSNGKNSLHRCSGSRRIDERFSSNWSSRGKINLKRSHELELGILNFLRENNRSYSPIGIFSEDLRNYIEHKKGIKINNKFSFYEIILNPDLTLKKVNVLKEFDDRLVSKEILDCLKNEKRWILHNDKKIKNATTFLIGLYYYPAEDGSKSFISIFTL